MPKKKQVLESRTMSKRAASKEALKQMQRLSVEASYDSPETYEITSEDDEEVVTVDASPKKKYRLSHRKSSDGNDRDVIVLKSIGWGEETLKLDAWVEELTPSQIEVRNKCKKELDDLNARLEKLLKETSSEVIFEGENTALYEMESEKPEHTPPTQAVKTTQPGKSTQAGKTIQAGKSTQPITPAPPAKSNSQSGFQLVMDPRSGVVVGTMTPANTVAPVTSTPVSATNKPQTRKRTRQQSNLSPVPTGPPPKIVKTTPSSNLSTTSTQPKPTEATSVGGLSHGSSQKAVSAVVDLTSDDGKPAADSREISFNKLQGKTFPSLVVVARPHLRLKDSSGSERTRLDAKVKAVLMQAPTKFTEWLIQQGLIRSEQTCTTHTMAKLKLGMYSDVSKFPFSGGYVWISECCPQRFVSVFSGSLFEGSPHPPSVILKLIYHWACQTNVQNVVQWVKVDNLYVKGLNTWLRAACTVALHTHVGPLGGPGKKVEVGVISLGTTSQDGHQRQVKVEVLGLLETDAKLLRLRAVEPLADGDRNYKKRFSKILEPLLQWVHHESVIVTDLTVDKSTLHTMGFKHVTQTSANESTVNNHTIMEYLRRIVPRMFQNTLSLLSRQIIQQFLDELVWREWFGNSSALAFDNIVVHLADQTRVDTNQSLIMRLNKVAANPFKNWSIKNYLVPHTPKTVSEPIIQKRYTKQKKVIPKAPSPTPDISKPPKAVSPDIPEQMVPLEHYYYGTIDGEKKSDDKVVLNLKCNMCKAHFTNNIRLMNHLFTHAHNVYGGAQQCHYCLATVTSKDILEKHIAGSHPTDTRCGDNFVCIICEGRFYNTYSLGKHMSKEHLPSELPYQCGTCGFRCSSHKQVIDHFYGAHDGSGVMQCPFCLKSTCIASNGRMVPQNLNYFLQHLQKHQKKSFPKKCPKCALWFIAKELMKDHQLKMHVTQRRKAGLVPWPVPRQSIMVPKSRQEEPVEEEEVDFSHIILNITEKLKCRECNYNLNSRDHFPALLNCANNNCQYSTCCKHAMQKHIAECKIFHSTLPVQRLPFQMFCVCGYNNSDGNLMAKHLAVCERKSAYPSEEAAKSATVTHSMLDVLGLIRRPEEPTLAASEIMEIDSDDDKNTTQKGKQNVATKPTTKTGRLKKGAKSKFAANKQKANKVVAPKETTPEIIDINDDESTTNNEAAKTTEPENDSNSKTQAPESDGQEVQVQQDDNNKSTPEKEEDNDKTSERERERDSVDNNVADTSEKMCVDNTEEERNTENAEVENNSEVEHNSEIEHSSETERSSAEVENNSDPEVEQINNTEKDDASKENNNEIINSEDVDMNPAEVDTDTVDQAQNDVDYSDKVEHAKEDESEPMDTDTSEPVKQILSEGNVLSDDGALV